MNAKQVIAAIAKLKPEKRRKVFDHLRAEFAHALETKWGLPYETVLEAIGRASDLTQRGVRGVIAEAVFILQVLPEALEGSGWAVVDAAIAADIPFDVVVEKGKTRVRVQVKNQRTERGEPKMKQAAWVAEVQKTRSGKKSGKPTRPYRFEDFDLIAVCLWPATRSWKRFAYCLTRDLVPRKHDKSMIEIMQRIPKDLRGGGWADDLVGRLEAFRTLHK